MKITRENTLRGNIARNFSTSVSPEELNTVKPEPEAKPSFYIAPKSGEKVFDKPPPKLKELYDEEVFTYFGCVDYSLAITSEKAFKIRSEDGIQVLSPRELDIAARLKLDISQGTPLHEALMEHGFVITEGPEGVKDHPCSLRLRYNKGLAYLTEGLAKTTEELQTAKRTMERIRFLLTNAGSPAWPSELEHGFKPHLLKPDHMDATEFESIRGTQKIVDPDKV